MKSEIYKQLKGDYPNVLSLEYFPYIWELIDEEDCTIKNRKEFFTYDLPLQSESFKEEVAKLVLNNQKYDVSIFSSHNISINKYVPEDIKCTTKRVVELFYKYCKWYGEILKKNPILLATTLTSSELIRVLDCYRSNFISLEFKPGETLTIFSNRLIEDSKRV